MKKTILLVLLCVISATVTSQDRYVKMTRDYKRLFSKRNIENIDNSLYSLGWERVSQITSPDILNGNLGLPYSKWFNEYGEEEIYLFDSKGSSDNMLQQVKCIKDNILNDDNPAQGFNYKRYIVITQAQDDVNILAIIFYDQHQN